MATMSWFKKTNPIPDVRHLEHSEALQAELHHYILERMEGDGLIFDLSTEMRDDIVLPLISYIEQFLDSHAGVVISTPYEEVARRLLDEMVGYGPIEDLLNDPTVDDILINGPKQIYIERYGRLEKASQTFHNDEHVIRVIRRMLAPLGRRVDESTPMVDARLPDGSRINAIIPPLALNGPCLSIRKFKTERLTEHNLLDNGAMSQEMLDFLRECVVSRRNMLLSGATGSGKTTLLNILSQHIQPHERVVTIEDAAELQLKNGHVVRLETRPPNSEGSGEVSARELVKNALRMRPDRIILGESRGGEVLDMLQAMNTGHLGSMSTLHANSPSDALIRLEMMVTLAGFRSGEHFIRKVVASAVELIVQVSRQADGRRLITEIVAVQGVGSQSIEILPLFRFNTETKQFERLVTPEMLKQENLS